MSSDTYQRPYDRPHTTQFDVRETVGMLPPEMRQFFTYLAAFGLAAYGSPAGADRERWERKAIVAAYLHGYESLFDLVDRDGTEAAAQLAGVAFRLIMERYFPIVAGDALACGLVERVTPDLFRIADRIERFYLPGGELAYDREQAAQRARDFPEHNKPERGMSPAEKAAYAAGGWSGLLAFWGEQRAEPEPVQ